MTYAEKLKDPRWQKKRLEILEQSGWECRRVKNGTCPNFDKETKPTLHVHHRLYVRKTAPWDYPDWAYEVLCEDCHEHEQELMGDAHAAIAKYPFLLSACASLGTLPSDNAKYISKVIDDCIWRLSEDVTMNLFRALESSHDAAVYGFGLGRSFSNEDRTHSIPQPDATESSNA